MCVSDPSGSDLSVPGGRLKINSVSWRKKAPRASYIDDVMARHLPVWLFWEGKKPEWIAMCEQTVFAHAPNVRVLSNADFEDLRDIDLDLDVGSIPVTQRSDYVRAFLLHRFGGLWIDSDCVVVRDLHPLLDQLPHVDFMGYRDESEWIASNFIGARPGSRIAAEYYSRVAHIIRQRRVLAWDSIGATSLTMVIDLLAIPWRRISAELIQPFDSTGPERLMKTGDDACHAATFNERSFCYMQYNSAVSKYLKREIDQQVLLADGTFFRYLHHVATSGPRPPASRRKPVSPSSYELAPFGVAAFREISPSSVLHVGVGFGKWGMIVRDVCDEAAGRVHRENWRVRLEGIEPVPAHVEEHQRLIYDYIHTGDGAQVMEDMKEPWDLIVIDESVAGWPHDFRRRVVRRALELGRNVLVLAPLSGPDAWTPPDLIPQAPRRQLIAGEESFGAFLYGVEGS